MTDRYKMVYAPLRLDLFGESRRGSQEFQLIDGSGAFHFPPATGSKNEDMADDFLGWTKMVLPRLLRFL